MSKFPSVPKLAKMGLGLAIAERLDLFVLQFGTSAQQHPVSK